MTVAVFHKESFWPLVLCCCVLTFIITNILHSQMMKKERDDDNHINAVLLKNNEEVRNGSLIRDTGGGRIGESQRNALNAEVCKASGASDPTAPRRHHDIAGEAGLGQPRCGERRQSAQGVRCSSAGKTHCHHNSKSRAHRQEAE